jgi:outer membrane immunogenic protein
MKNIIFATAVALLSAAPAFAADFTGPRLGVTFGTDNATRNTAVKDLSYGVDAGYDLQLGKVVLGGDVTVDNVFDRRNVGVGVRAGVVANENVLVYARAGYANWHQAAARTFEGLRVGAGVETNILGPVYAKAEFRHVDYGRVKTNGGLVGVGLRF